VAEDSQTHAGGSGIGLALTKELVELHHGTITVESHPSKGTSFTVFIPFGKEQYGEDELVSGEDAITKSPEPTSEWAIVEEISGHVVEDEIIKKNEKPILLVVEDNQDMMEYISSHLEKKYKLLKAKDGEQGLTTALEQLPDLIISDVMMPRMDGIAMTERLKTDQRTSHIPVIMLTARASVDSKIEGLETGADDYVTKPFNARELQTRVKNLIEQRTKLREHFAKELNAGITITKENQLPSMDQKFIQKAVEVVTEHLSENEFDINQFSAEMALSRSQLHRKIKALTNKNATEFIRTIRLNKAAELLKQKTDNVTQIAYETGFNNLSWFAKAFKEQFGVSPSEYTKQKK
jgi:DNA-binding response OmpR family regulator